MKLREKISDLLYRWDEKAESVRLFLSDAADPLIAVGELAAAKFKLVLRHLAGIRSDGTFGIAELDRDFEILRRQKYEELLAGRFGGAVRGIARLSETMGRTLDNMEIRQRAAAHDLSLRMEKINEYVEANSRRVVTVASGTLGCFMAVCLTVNAGTVYNYSYHGTELGTVKDKADIAVAAEQLVTEGNGSGDSESEVQINADPSEDITYEKEFDLSAAVDSADDVLDKLANLDELQGKGYAITIDGTQYALVESKEVAQKILDTMKALYVTRESAVTEAAAEQAPAEEPETVNLDGEAVTPFIPGYQEGQNAEAQPAQAEPAAEQKPEAAAAAETGAAQNTAAQAGAEGQSSRELAAVTRNVILAHMAKSIGMVSDTGDSVDSETGTIDGTSAGNINNNAANLLDEETIAYLKSIDYDTADIEAMTGVAPEDVTFAQDVKIEEATANVSDFLTFDEAIGSFVGEDGTIVAPVDLLTKEIVVYDMPVAYQTETVEDSSMYEDEKEVITPGVTGYETVVAYLTRINGDETGRIVLNESVKTEPVNEVVKVGTKKRPSSAPTGTYIKPCSGSFSSGYGRRWGRTHTGVDLAAPAGTPIYAADGGTVTYAQYNASGYGNLIKISHGGSTETYYGHCSRILVSVGDKVAQGQLIGLVGSTGRSTGNHLHFEIRFGGNPVNPWPYIS